MSSSAETTSEFDADDANDPSRERSVAELMSLGVVKAELCVQVLRQGFVLAHEAFREREVDRWCKVTHNLFRFARLGQLELKRVAAERAKNGDKGDTLPPADMAVVNELRRQLLYGDESLDSLYEAALREDAGTPCPDEGHPEMRWPGDREPPSGNRARGGDRTANVRPDDPSAAPICDDSPSGANPLLNRDVTTGATTEESLNTPCNSVPEQSEVREPTQPPVAESTGNTPADNLPRVRTLLIWFALWLVGATGTMSGAAKDTSNIEGPVWKRRQATRDRFSQTTNIDRKNTQRELIHRQTADGKRSAGHPLDTS